MAASQLESSVASLELDRPQMVFAICRRMCIAHPSSVPQLERWREQGCVFGANFFPAEGLMTWAGQSSAWRSGMHLKFKRATSHYRAFFAGSRTTPFLIGERMRT